MIPRVRYATSAAAALVVLAAVACGADGGEGSVDADAFVTTMAELRRAATAAGDSVAFAAARDSILDQHGVSEVDLERFVDGTSDDPERMAELWQRIQDLVAPPVDSTAADSGSVPDSLIPGRDTTATD